MEEASVYIGRFQPPTAGHEEIINNMKADQDKTGIKPTVVMVTSKEDRNNPISPDLRQKVLEELGVDVMATDNPIKALRELAQSKKIRKSYSGPDRNYAELFNQIGANPEHVQYHQRYNNIAGTDLRNLAEEGRYGKFKQMMAQVPDELQRRLYNAIRDFIPAEQKDGRRKATGITAKPKPQKKPNNIDQLAKLVRRR